MTDETPKGETPKGRQLGRGLNALFGEEQEDYSSLDAVRDSKNVPVEFLKPSRFQPRRRFDEDQLAALVASVRERGILQPLLVRRDPENPNAYEIVAGERRWRAAQGAGLHEVPVIIKELTDQGALEIALVENIQRQDLNAIEEGEGYRRLIEEFSHTQEDLARVVGKSRSHVANTMRLLGLSDGVRALVEGGALSPGHARALLNAEKPDALAKRVIKRGLNVRQTERLVQRQKEGPSGGGRSGGRDADTVALENDLSNLLGLKVSVRFHGIGGELVIHYRTVDQLDDVLYRLGHTAPPPSVTDTD